MAPPNHTSFNGSTVAGDSMNSMSISSSFEHVNHEEINKILQALESLLNQAKTPQCKDSLERLRSFFNKAYDAHSNSLCLNEIYKNLIESLSKEPDLDHAALYEVLGLNKKQAELDDFSNLADLIKGQIAGFSEQKLLEMCTFSKISYGNVDRKLEKGKYKTKRQFEEEGYQIIKFYDNELIEDKYCLDTDYKLEQHDVGYALTGSNSYNRDAGYVFIKKEREKKEEITISYHGTRDLNDVKEDLRASLAKLSFLPEDHRVHSGFYSLFRCSWPSVHKILQGHANDQGLEIKDLKINVTGHSMGGALANIAALCLNKTEDAKDVHVATFGSPRVFYNSAAEVYNECLGSKTIRVACQSDPVPCLPHGNAGMHYKHVGKLLKLGTGNTLECLQPHYHKIDTYYNLIQKVQQENFKSDNNPSKYRHIAYIFGLFYHAVLSYVDVDDEGFFKKVEEENKDIKLSEIPIEYAPKLEERFKQGKQEVAKLTNEKTQLEERLHIIQQSLDEKIEELRKLEQECKSANKKLIQEQQETSKFRDQVDKLTKTLQEREGQLTEENRALCVCGEVKSSIRTK
ncbi:MAG: hypothetical protein ACEY3H_00415 [Wolbachia sp.]